MPIKIVDNWTESWKWISTWAALIIAAWAELPPDVQAWVLTKLPGELTPMDVVGYTAIAGLIGRYIKQSKDKA